LNDQLNLRVSVWDFCASIGAELARLQRCNQEHLLVAIRKQKLTWRETREVMPALISKPEREYEEILRDIRATILRPIVGFPICTMQAEAGAWKKDRNNSARKITWQFTTADVRIKLKRLYPNLGSRKKQIYRFTSRIQADFAAPSIAKSST